MYVVEDDSVDVDENDNGSVGGPLDDAEDDPVDVGDSGGVGGLLDGVDYWMVQKMTRLR